jgi:potassium-transporting ATPase potassium-binding subunit
VANELLGVLATFVIWLLLGTALGRYLGAALRSHAERKETHWSDRAFGWFERPLWRLAGIANPDTSMTWRAYAGAMLGSNLVMVVLVYLGLLSMSLLPLNPDGIQGMEPTLAFHTAAAFITNTDQQHYAGETGVSSFGQIALLMFLQFTSAATGLAAFTAICRALSNRESPLVGNFYGDLMRAITRVLLPLSLVVAVLLLWQGVPMSWSGRTIYSGVDGQQGAISRGPIAAFMAIKHLGTNGGGYFGANAAHPYENPTYLANMILVIAQVLLPLACVWAFGHITGRRKVARAIFAAMLIMYVVGAAVAMQQEWHGNRTLTSLGISQPTGNLEGKEVRFGTLASAYFANSTTATSCGAVNAMHDSLTPIAGLVCLVNMWVNCIFGGDGVGFINMLLYVIITVFIAGLMVGRTPEFLGKKIEVREVKLAALALLLHPALILGFAAVTCAIPSFAAATSNPGAHGFSQMLYEYTSAAANNGSGFEGLGDNTPWWNISCGLVMILGRYIPIIAPLALAASLGAKKTVPESVGTFHTDNLLFVFMLLAIVAIVGALLFLPVAVLGPVAEFVSRGYWR